MYILIEFVTLYLARPIRSEIFCESKKTSLEQVFTDAPMDKTLPSYVSCINCQMLYKLWMTVSYL